MYPLFSAAAGHQPGAGGSAALTVQVPAERAGGSIYKMRVGMTCRDVFISEKKGAREGETQRAWIR